MHIPSSVSVAWHRPFQSRLLHTRFASAAVAEPPPAQAPTDTQVPAAAPASKSQASTWLQQMADSINNPFWQILFAQNAAGKLQIHYKPFDATKAREGLSLFHGVGHDERKWYVGDPVQLLERPLSDTIHLLEDITGCPLPNKPIGTPDAGAHWGRRANYINVIPRAFGKLENDGHHMREGILGSMKLLPLVPNSQPGIANCLLLSGVLPPIMGEGWAHGHQEESSLYTMDLRMIEKNGKRVLDLEKGLSADLFPSENTGMSRADYLKAYNDLAHFRGLKTGLFLVISEDQIKVNGQQFRWNDHKEDFIQACCDLVGLGFDALYLDSAKHVGGRELGSYCGVGRLPNYDEMQTITDQVRRRTGRGDISFIGERCDQDVSHFKGMGLTAGTGGVWCSKDAIIKATYEQNGSREYAAGPAIADDNDTGAMSYDERLGRLNDGLSGAYGAEKLPTIFTMHDLWPLNWSTNYHDLMLHNKSFAQDGKPETHHANLFATDDSAKGYRWRVNELFARIAGF